MAGAIQMGVVPSLNWNASFNSISFKRTWIQRDISPKAGLNSASLCGPIYTTWERRNWNSGVYLKLQLRQLSCPLYIVRNLQNRRTALANGSNHIIHVEIFIRTSKIVKSSVCIIDTSITLKVQWNHTYILTSYTACPTDNEFGVYMEYFTN